MKSTKVKIKECSSQRLLELGFTTGLEAFKIDLKWFGVMFFVRGAWIVLRRSETDFLKLEEIS